MKQPQWKSRVRREASTSHMCEEYRLAVEQSKTREELIDLYKSCVDWALENGTPSLSLLRSEYPDCQKDGLYVDTAFHGELLDGQQVYIFHNCKGTICVDLNVEKAIIPMLYFANGCEMTVKRPDSSRIGTIGVPLYIFGQNKITTENTDFVKFTIYREKCLGSDSK